MLRIKWPQGTDAHLHTDLIPSDVLWSLGPTTICHDVIGLEGVCYKAKCNVYRTDSEIEFDYTPYRTFNESNGMLLGILRLTTSKHVPQIFWKNQGQANFQRIDAEVVFESETPLTTTDSGQDLKSARQTETALLIKARLGQGKFREHLQRRWTTCALTMIANPKILRASHIKPWEFCAAVERLDPNNGLLLAAHVDALFDKYLITFQPTGKLIWHQSVSKADRAILNLPNELRLPLTLKEQGYLRHHNQKFNEL